MTDHYNTRGVATRTFSIPLFTVLSSFVVVLIGYTSSAAIIWQATFAAGTTTKRIIGWITALGLAIGVSMLTLTLWYRTPVLTAWSMLGVALLVTGLHGASIQDAIGVFIVANALIVLCGVIGLSTRLMEIIPHPLASAVLAGTLLRFGLQALNGLNSELILCGNMLLAWLVLKVTALGYAIIIAILAGIAITLVKGDIVTDSVNLSSILPTFTVPHFSLTHCISIVLPLLLATMAPQSTPGITTMRASEYSLPVSPLIAFTSLLALLFSLFGVYPIYIAAITIAICQSSEAHPDADRRWFTMTAAGTFYILAGVFGGSVTGLMTALPVSWIQVLTGLALLGMISDSLYQALYNEAEHDAAIVTFLVTASGLMVFGVGSAFWGLIVGSACYSMLALFHRA